MSSALRFLLIFCLFAGGMKAFPPAPYHTIYGIVRDQVGQTLDVQGAQIILLKGQSEVGRAPVVTGLQLDQNYEISLRIDTGRPGTALYTSAAIQANTPYSLAVEMNGQRFYPIEVAGTLTAGKGGERVRLDLNLGEDSDGDGLPDIWEMWQLYQAGYYPDANGVWPLHLIDRDGDFDGDGVSNWHEYVAGTFAGDATEKFDMQIKEKAAAFVRLEFFAITGKVYTIERSLNMQGWEAVPFSFTAEGAPQQVFRAEDVGILPVFTTPVPGGAREFYRLTVR